MPNVRMESKSASTTPAASSVPNLAIAATSNMKAIVSADLRLDHAQSCPTQGRYPPLQTVAKVGACEWGQQRAQPDPLKELVWGDCKAEEVGPSFVENTKARCLDGIDNDCDGLADFGDTKCNAFCTPTQILPCYTAASKTLNVGRCRSGLKTCQDDNTWGPCVGEKAPSKEICNKEDDDCNGLIDDGLTGCPSQFAKKDNNGLLF